MFLFKKIIAPVFMPVSVCVEILLIGLFLLWFTKRQRAGKIIVTIGFISLLGFGYEALPNKMNEVLEYRYPAFQAEILEDDVEWVVVLGAGLRAVGRGQRSDDSEGLRNTNRPSANSQLSDASIASSW